MTLERVVRPFQLTDVFSARVLPPNAAIVPQEQKTVIIEIKSSADKDYIEEPPPFFLGYTVEWAEDKSQRVTSQVTIKNKDDPEQQLVVDRIEKMVIKNSHTREEIPIKMDWSESGGSATVVSESGGSAF